MASLMKEEHDELDKGIMLHQHLINAGNDDLVVDPLFCIEKRSYYKGSYDRIVECLETKCGIEAEESRAWASYYMGERKAWARYLVPLIQDKREQLNQEDVAEAKTSDLAEAKALLSEWGNRLIDNLLEGIECMGANKSERKDVMEVIELFKKSLSEAKSCRLRYLASWKLGEFYGIMMEPIEEKMQWYRIQLKEAEATGWKRAKICALFNLCKALCICGQFKEAAEIEKELEIIGVDDPFTMGLSLHCKGNLAHFMGNFNKCIEANRDAIDKLENNRISGMFEHLHMFAISEAIKQIEKAIDDEQIEKEHLNELDEDIMLHQHLINAGNDELPEDPRFSIKMRSCYEGSYDRIVQCLETKCGIEAEESKAWASYYGGIWRLCACARDLEVKPSEPILDRMVEVILELFKESLSEAKSCRLRYLASWQLGYWDGIMTNNKPIQRMRWSRIQLEEAEATGWKRAKVCALFNLCKALRICGQFEEAAEIEKELEIKGAHDPFTMGLSLHCKANLAHLMGNFNECIETNRDAIDKLETTGSSGMFEHLRMRTIFEANGQIEKAKQKEGFLGKGESKATMLSLLAFFREDDDGFNRSIISHQYRIAGSDVEVVEIASLLFKAEWQERNGGWDMVPITDEQIPTILERIMCCLEDKCQIDAAESRAESRAWASYYVGHLLLLQREHDEENFQRPNAIIGMFEESLHGKSSSSTLRFLASWELADVFAKNTDHIEAIKILKIHLQEVESENSSWKSAYAKVYALYRLCLALCETAQFPEAEKIKDKLRKVESGGPLAEGLSFRCQGIIAYGKGNFDESKQAHRKAVLALGDVEIVEINDHISGRSFPFTQSQTVIMTAIEQSKHDGKMSSLTDKYPEWLEIISADPLRRQATNYLENSKFDEADEIASQLLQQSRKSHNAGQYALDLMFKAQIAQSSGSWSNVLPVDTDAIESWYTEAQRLAMIESWFTEAERVVSQEPNRCRQDIITAEAEMYFRMHRFDKAVEKYRQCLHMFMEIEENFGKQIQKQKNFGDHNKGRICYLESMKKCFKHMQVSILMNLEDILMQSTTLGMVTKLPFKNIEIGSFLLEGHHVKRALIWAERERTRDLLYAIQNKLHDDAYLKDLSQFDKNDAQAWSELQYISSLVGQDTVFIVFTVVGKYFFSYFFHAANDAPMVANGTLNMSEKAEEFVVPGLQEAIKSILENDADDRQSKEYLEYLFNICIKPFKERLKDANIKKIIIVPDAEISLLPFAALIDSEDGQYLIQKYEVSIISSLRMFKHCEMRREHLIQMSEGHRALVVGNPPTNRTNLPDLQGAEEEAKMVSNTLIGISMTTKLLINEEATPKAVSSYLSESFWIHMACHATFKAKYPNGALVLAKPPKNLLTAEEIANGPDLKAVVTVLSACSSGTGQIRAEGTIGLIRSLHLAGVPIVVASLWEVVDAATMEFMKRFYANICNNIQLAFALKKTMVSMIEEGYKPLHWAPFFISGSPSFHLSQCKSLKHVFNGGGSTLSLP